MKFEFHTIESAPESVKPDLEAAQKAYGSVPNLYRGFATNPATLKIYLAFNEQLRQHGTMSPIEQQVVYLTVSAENGCTYCVGAHSVLADMSKMPAGTVEELRSQKALTDTKLDALRNFTLSVIEHRGWVPEADLAEFARAGYNESQVLEVLTIVAQKTISNYFNHLAQTPLDDMFASRAWEPNQVQSKSA
jgi:uncharacterized peroxidase-related enzyme